MRIVKSEATKKLLLEYEAARLAHNATKRVLQSLKETVLECLDEGVLYDIGGRFAGLKSVHVGEHYVKATEWMSVQFYKQEEETDGEEKE